MIRFDRSPASIVVVCSSCPTWREVRADPGQAYLVAADHETRCHAGADQARALAMQASRRRRVS